MTNEIEPAALTVEEFAAKYRLGRSTVYNLIGDGAITAVKVGKSMRIDAASAQRWFTSLPRADIRPTRRAA